MPQGADYQHGERYKIATLREAVFSRDDYTCQCCGRSIKDGAILHVHHIEYRSNGGTNSMSNLMTVCDDCHTPENHQPDGKLYGLKPKLKDFKGATFMTTVRWQILDELKQTLPNINIHITYGAETKERRRTLNISKSHVNDAYVMGDFHPKHRTRPVFFKKKRRNNRCLEKFYDAKYIDSRDGSKKSGKQLFNGRINRNHKQDSENLHVYRQKKVSKGRRSIRKKHYAIQPHDIVMYNERKYEVQGCITYGRYAVLMPGRINAPVSKLTILKYSGGYTGLHLTA